MDELAQLTDDIGHCVVENFAVGREGYGNVFFEGITDVTGLNLDDIGSYCFCGILFFEVFRNYFLFGKKCSEVLENSVPNYPFTKLNPSHKVADEIISHQLF